MSELAQHGTDYGVVEREPPSTVERNLAIGSRLWASSLVFFFFAFLFAFFYLRSLNERGLFKPKGVDAPQGWGIAIMRLPRRERGAAAVGCGRPARRPAAGVAAERARRARARPCGGRAADRRLGEHRLRADGRRLRVGVPRLDRALHDLRFRDALLARDLSRALVSLPRPSRSEGPRSSPATPPAIPTATRPTSRTQCT